MPEILTIANLRPAAGRGEPEQNLGSGFVEWNSALAITTRPRRLPYYFPVYSLILKLSDGWNVNKQEVIFSGDYGIYFNVSMYSIILKKLLWKLLRKHLLSSHHLFVQSQQWKPQNNREICLNLIRTRERCYCFDLNWIVLNNTIGLTQITVFTATLHIYAHVFFWVHEFSFFCMFICWYMLIHMFICYMFIFACFFVCFFCMFIYSL